MRMKNAKLTWTSKKSVRLWNIRHKISVKDKCQRNNDSKAVKIPSEEIANGQDMVSK